MDRVRLVGIARASTGRPARSVLVQRTIVADAQGAFGRIDELEPFDIEVDGGKKLRVELTKDARIEPLETEKLEWGEIENDPSFAELRERGPGPHVKVTVKRAAIRDGDRVALAGEEKEFAFDEAGAAMRDAPKRQLTAVTADVLATGADAEEIVAHVVDAPDEKPKPRKKKPKDEKQPRTLRSYVTVPRVFALLGVTSALLASTMRFSPAKLDFAFIAIVMFGIGTLAAAWRTLPRFVRGKTVVEDASNANVGVAVMGGLVVATMAFVALLSDFRYAWSPQGGVTAENPEVNASWLVGPLGVIYLVVLAVTLAWSSKRRASLLSTVVGAPPFTEPPNAARWGSAAGIVRDPTPVSVAGAPRALANVIEREVRPGSDPDIVTESVLNAGTFFVDSDVGTFELDPSGATWASSVRMVTTDTEKKHVFADVVVIGGHVVVAGRAVTPAKGEPARFVEGRAESLVFYATGRDEDARAKARIHLWRRRAAIGSLVAAAAAIAGLMAAYEPELPAFHTAGSGDGL